jgi:hypothetical protein
MVQSLPQAGKKNGSDTYDHFENDWDPTEFSREAGPIKNEPIDAEQDRGFSISWDDRIS